MRKTEAPMRLLSDRKHIPTKKLQAHDENEPSAIADDLDLTSKSSVKNKFKL